MTKREDTIQMSVGGLTLDPVTKTPIVILKDTDNKLNLPIWIGLLEATAMATEIEGIKMARPMTHDLLKNILGEVGCSIESVEITELKENTYYALVHINIGGRELVVDSRQAMPSHLPCEPRARFMLPRRFWKPRVSCSKAKRPKKPPWKMCQMFPRKNGPKFLKDGPGRLQV